MELGFWKKLKKPIMVIAPMSGVTDQAFRLMFLKYGKPSVFWTEFVSAEGLFSRGREYCLKLLKFDKRERPIVAQLFGAEPEYFEKAAKEIVMLGFDGIDINMGCPDKAIESQGAGAALIKNISLAKEIIRATKRGAAAQTRWASLVPPRKGGRGIPVSVKTRVGYSKNEINTWIKAILEEQPAALTVHFRTRDERYFGPAHWELAKEVVALRDKISPKTLILGNGDVKSLEQARELAKENKLDGIMIGRAVVGDPWFFIGKTPSIKERLGAILEHAELFNKVGDPKQFGSKKKHFHAYCKGFRGAKEMREKLMKVKNFSDFTLLHLGLVYWYNIIIKINKNINLWRKKY